MAYHPSRNPFRQARLAATDQEAVDAYKARSVWGAWWSLGDVLRDRLFDRDEQRWVRRHGARLDALACLVESPRNDAEHHFVEVCAGRAMPRSARERLWLRVQIACRYEGALERAARTDLAEHLAAAQAAEIQAMRMAVRDAEEIAAELLEELQVLQGRPWAVRRRSLCNVRYATPLFKVAEAAGPPTRRFLIERVAA